jgi:ribosomal protein S18 acetylase RimI-like enzyme
MMVNGHVEPLAWDSAWLDFPVGRAVAKTPQEVVEAVARSRAAGLHLLYLVVDSKSEAAIMRAQASGAYLADVRLTYHKPLPAEAATSATTQLPDIDYQRMTAYSTALDRLAQLSSQHSRFRQDTRIPALACDALYAEWLRQALASGQAWAAVRQGIPLGLLTLGTRQSHTSIELLAVSPAARHQRIGQGLVRVAQREAARQGQPLLQVVTQQANQAAQLFYEHCGFRLACREHVFHLWRQPE